ncbi:reverse transcriptase N-terminal domain-containing protein [Actinacidiphila oryziradicis]|uniref:Reverse transcriptase N-terminal domain-containing protein n=1 Tax=Actinacidiphila oryziradicis TaxID=2571141 RepID=A0A4U0RMK3_9ACTN|nr:reverse transcriptase N-terminal domain-containing protein [Actinacidiphila oryziradicis]TJZ97103.1 hypothetical protein FCI23_49980 [Actinacidiphila oryziradicis]
MVRAAEPGAVVNGPDGGSLDWDRVNWYSVERDVRRLRQRIFAAERAGDSKRVANLVRRSSPGPPRRDPRRPLLRRPPSAPPRSHRPDLHHTV